MSLAVETRSLTKRYTHQTGLSDLFRPRKLAETTALDGVNVRIADGEVFGLLGPNGSGKTTFLRLLSTILTPSSGTASIFGNDIRTEPHQVRGLVALVTGEERSLFWRLTARQNLEFFASLYGRGRKSAKRKIDELLELFDLAHVRDVRVGEYSTGMKQRLAIARGLLSEPKLLFLDEPTRGLDPVAAHALLDRVRERAVEHFANTVILTTHIMREIEQLCDRIAILDHGRVVYQGTVRDLQSSMDRYDTYVFTVTALGDRAFDRIGRRPDVKSCKRCTNENGLTEIEVVFSRNGTPLSGLLRDLLDDDAEIVRCSRREQSFEETFRSFLDSGAVESGEGEGG